MTSLLVTMGSDAREFYDSFANKYDLMVSDRRYDKDLPFFLTIFKKHNVRSILDCSCGTGKHIARFSKAGFEVTGSDISAEMISTARKNAKAFGENVNLFQADFKRLPVVFGKKFDCVICWGNSLGHELEERGILSALRSMFGVLNDKGVVVIHIRNLPKWVRENRRIVPVHYQKEPNGDRRVFIYVVDFGRVRTRFNVVSLIESNGKPEFKVDSVDYRIISVKRLKELVEQAGFGHVEVFGRQPGGKFTRFDEMRSEDAILVGTR